MFIERARPKPSALRQEGNVLERARPEPPALRQEGNVLCSSGVHSPSINSNRCSGLYSTSNLLSRLRYSLLKLFFA